MRLLDPVLALALILPMPALAGGLYDTTRPDLPDWLRSHNYLAAPDAPAKAAPVDVENRSSAPVLCQITLAHWYMIRTDPVPAGGSETLPFRFEPQSGTVSWLNAAGEDMAVEGLSCGTSAQIDARPTGLPFHRIVAQARILTCTSQGCGAQ
ncbi:hypothetical protein [Thioclava sp. GXIMD2076]|uniref:hypothetical protein n=1 Tax=unclassified Thioclava TaxID=2621713 RepID=UPI0030CB0C16